MNFPKHNCGLYLTHNEHKNNYETVLDYISANELLVFLNEQALTECVKNNEIWTLQWYPDTPVGFYIIAAPTLEKLLEHAAQIESNIRKDI